MESKLQESSASGGKGSEQVKVVRYEYISDDEDEAEDDMDDLLRYEIVPESDEDEDDDDLDLEAEETLASLERTVQRRTQSRKNVESKLSADDSSEEHRVVSEQSGQRSARRQVAETEETRAQTMVRPAVIDDFFRSFLIKVGMERTLDIFNTEWYELDAKGKLNAELIGAVPDIYLRNEELDNQVKELRDELERTKAVADKAQSTWDKFRKERDFHKLNHKRVVQEKNTLIQEIKRLKKHYQTYEPTIGQLRQKYEAAMKEKMLMKIERDKFSARNETLEIQVRALEDTSGVPAIANPESSLTKPSKASSFMASTAASRASRAPSKSPKKKIENGLPSVDPINPYLDTKFNKPSVQNLQVLKTFEGHMNAISALAYHPKKQVLATASDDQTWKLWSIPNGELIMSGEGHLDWVAGVDFNPAGTHLLSASGDGTVKLWDFERAACSATLTDHAQPVWGVSWHYSGGFFASCSMDATARLWDVESQKVLQTFRGHVDSVNAVRFQPFSSNVCTASGDKTVSMWDARSGLCVQTFFGHTNACNSLALNLQGDIIASCDADGIVRVWDVRMVKELTSFEGGAHALNDVAFHRSGKILAAASDDGIVRMFDLDRNETVSQIKAHEDAVQAVVFDPNSKYFVSAASDKTFRVYNI